MMVGIKSNNGGVGILFVLDFVKSEEDGKKCVDIVEKNDEHGLLLKEKSVKALYSLSK